MSFKEKWTRVQAEIAAKTQKQKDEDSRGAEASYREFERKRAVIQSYTPSEIRTCTNRNRERIQNILLQRAADGYKDYADDYSIFRRQVSWECHSHFEKIVGTIAHENGLKFEPTLSYYNYTRGAYSYSHWRVSWP